MQMSFDIGRYDHIGIALLMASALTLLNGRMVLTGILLTFGDLVHEAFMVYAFLIVAALLLQPNLQDRPISIGYLTVLLPPVLTAGFILLFGNVSGDLNALLGPDIGIGMNAFQRDFIGIGNHFLWQDYVVWGSILRHHT